MSLHLAEISRNVEPNAHAALILDGAGYHIAGDLEVPHNITLIRLPPYAPELNPVENIWAYLRSNKLANTVYEDYDDILDKASEAWMFFAEDKNTVASITSRHWAHVNL
jgi:transposase